MQAYKHKTSIQLRFKDIDALGHVNNANHVTFLELARVYYFDEVVGPVNWSETGVILASISVSYKKIIGLKDQVFVHTRCSKIGNKSMTLDYMITNDNEEIFAMASSVLVAYNYRENKTVEVPDEWREKLMRYDSI